jgi:hypothetical protein
MKTLFSRKSICGMFLSVFLTVGLVLGITPLNPFSAPVLASPDGPGAGPTMLTGTSFESEVGGKWNNGGHQNEGDPQVHVGTVERFPDITAPDGNYSCRFTYPQGFNGGYAPGQAWPPDIGEHDEIELQFWFKVSANWQWHPVVQKLIYFGLGTEKNGGSHYIGLGYGREHAVTVQTQFTTGFADNHFGGNVDILTSDVWHHIKMYAKVSTGPRRHDGLLKLWFDDSLIINRSDVMWADTGITGGFNFVRVYPFFFFFLSSVTNQMYMFFDDIKIYVPGEGGGVPSVPQNFMATPGDRQVRLSWGTPSSNGGSAITRYQVSANNGATWVTESSNTEHTFTGLTNGTPYIFRVRAVNEAGNGAEATVTSTPVSNATILTLNAPATVTITTGGRREVQFTASAAGTYTFESSDRGALDPKAYSNATGSATIDDDSGGNLNYRFRQTLAASQTFTFYSGVFNDSTTANGSYKVTVTTVSTPSALTLALNTPSTITITAGGRRAVQFTAPAAGTYTFESSDRGSLDPKAYSNATGSATIDDDSGGNLNYRFRQTLAAGQTFTFYSGVFNDSATANGSYKVTVTTVSTPSALTLTLNTPSTIAITAGGRRAVQFTAPATGTYTFESSDRGALDPKAYSNATGSAAIDDDSGGNLNYRFRQTLAAGQTFTFYSGVFSDSATANGSYRVIVTTN